jgi:hypothetical protein
MEPFNVAITPLLRSLGNLSYGDDTTVDKLI